MGSPPPVITPNPLLSHPHTRGFIAIVDVNLAQPSDRIESLFEGFLSRQQYVERRKDALSLLEHKALDLRVSPSFDKPPEHLMEEDNVD